MKRAVFILFLLWPAWAASQGIKLSGELAPLMEQARIEGQASTVLAGEVAARMREQGIEQPVRVSVHRLHRLKDPDCARLKVSFDQRQVMLPNETMPRDRHAEFYLNWCEGGRPPLSSDGAQPAVPEGQP
ncbi:MAG TPA: hypothetical protein PLL19_13390 [Thiobacillaceae bacterium]|nr:hypothetical protein [Thiobacillaceae bacterium]